MLLSSPARSLCGLFFTLALVGCTQGLTATATAPAAAPAAAAITADSYHSGKVQQLFVVVPDANEGLLPRAAEPEAEPAASAGTGAGAQTTPVAPPPQVQPPPVTPAVLAAAPKSPEFLAAEAWQELYGRIRRQQVTPAVAATEFAQRHQALLRAFATADFGSTQRSYPLLGYATRDGKPGAAYAPKGYRFFAASGKQAHPAYDLPIRDSNRDGLDDRNDKAVPVLAYSGGVVVAVEAGWNAARPGLDGNYVWLFNPRESRYYCYAQLALVAVAVGDVIRTGEQLGTAGRSGDRASQAAAATHLHLLTLRYRDGQLAPFDIWPGLVAASRGT